jgi:SAM-dependent methyltransferase
MYKDKDILGQLIARPDAFSRDDDADDEVFYSRPRFVEHLDETARQKVTALIESLVVEKHPTILDLMAAQSSHFPDNLDPTEVVGLGLNEDELKANRRLDDYIVHDLNQDSTLPFRSETFDVVLNVISIQYLTDPFAMFREVGRILKAGGLLLVVFSNRSFPTKSVKLWELLVESERVEFVKMCFEQSGLFERVDTYLAMGDPRPSEDKYAHIGVPSDPIYAVFGEKKGIPANRPARRLPESALDMPSEEELARRKSEVAATMRCPYCMELLRPWRITDNPWSTWDHDLFVCTNDACPYLIRGWRSMYDQGNAGVSYRLVYDQLKDAFLTIPVPNLKVIKSTVHEV